MMKPDPKIVQKEPETLHRQQTRGTILIPVLTASALCLAAFILLLLTGSGEYESTAQWANISIMFMILPVALIGLAVLLILLVLAKLIGGWNQTLPPYLKFFRLKTLEINRTIRSTAQKPTIPIIGIKAMFAGIKSLFRR